MYNYLRNCLRNRPSRQTLPKELISRIYLYKHAKGSTMYKSLQNVLMILTLVSEWGLDGGAGKQNLSECAHIGARRENNWEEIWNLRPELDLVYGRNRQNTNYTNFKENGLHPTTRYTVMQAFHDGALHYLRLCNIQSHCTLKSKLKVMRQ